MKIKCPGCGKILSIPDTAAGKMVKCPCGKQLRIPAKKSVAGQAPARAAAPAPAGRTTSSPGPRPAAARPQPPQQQDAGFFDELTDTDLQPVKPVFNLKQSQARQASSKPINPYLASAAGGDNRRGTQPLPGGMTLATPSSRILAHLLDMAFHLSSFGISFGIGMIVRLFVLPPDNSDADIGKLIVNVTAMCGTLLFICFHALSIHISGQSFGKRLLGIRIVNKETGVTASIVDGFFVRYLIFYSLTSIPLLGFVLGLADLLYLFQEGHETAHDRMAKTIVVKAV